MHVLWLKGQDSKDVKGQTKERECRCFKEAKTLASKVGYGVEDLLHMLDLFAKNENWLGLAVGELKFWV